MAVAVQLDFFKKPPSPLELVHARVTELDERQDKLRKGLFSRHNKLANRIEAQEDEINKLKNELKMLKKRLKD